MENAENYPINKPEIAMTKIQKLCGINPEQALRVVINNLIARQEFDKAKELFNNFSKSRGDGTVISNDLLPLRREIRNAEISYMVKKLINMDGTEEEEEKCWNLIQSGVRMGNVKLSSIYLGENESDSRKITLEDIWPDKDEVAIIKWATERLR